MPKEVHHEGKVYSFDPSVADADIALAMDDVLAHRLGASFGTIEDPSGHRTREEVLSDFSLTFKGTNIEAHPEKFLPPAEEQQNYSYYSYMYANPSAPKGVPGLPEGTSLPGFVYKNQLNTVAAPRDDLTPVHELIHMTVQRQGGMGRYLDLLSEEERGAWDEMVTVARRIVMPHMLVSDNLSNTRFDERDRLGSVKLEREPTIYSHEELLAPLRSFEARMKKGKTLLDNPVLKATFFSGEKGDLKYRAYRKLADTDLKTPFEAGLKLGRDMMFGLTEMDEPIDYAKGAAP